MHTLTCVCREKYLIGISRETLFRFLCCTSFCPCFCVAVAPHSKGLVACVLLGEDGFVLRGVTASPPPPHPHRVFAFVIPFSAGWSCCSFPCTAGFFWGGCCADRFGRVFRLLSRAFLQMVRDLKEAAEISMGTEITGMDIVSIKALADQVRKAQTRQYGNCSP